MNTPWAGRFLWALAVVQMGTVAGQEQARVRLQVQAGKAWIGSVAFSPDGRSVVACDNGYARLSDVASGREAQRFEGFRVAFSPDGRSVLTGGLDRIAQMIVAGLLRTLDLIAGSART